MKRILPTDSHLFTIIIQNVRRSILLFSPIFLSLNSYSQTIDLKSINGEMLISGKQEFTESWTSSKASRDKGLWWQDHYYVKEEDRNYQTWEGAVKNSVSPLLGQIVAKGPCSICLDQLGTGKQYGGRIKMFDAETGAGFIPCPLKGVLENGIFNHGWIPEGKEVIIDVYAVMGSYNNMVNTGEFLYPAPQDVEYEIWYFPRGEGSDVVVTGGQEEQEDDMGNIIFGKEEDCRPESANISYRSIEDDIMEECRRKLLQRKSQRDNLIAKNREWKLEDQRKIEQRWEAVIGKWERIYNKDCNNTAKNFFCDRVSILLGRYRTERQNELDASAKWYDDQIRKFGEDYENYKRELGEECRNLCTIEIPPLTASSSKPRPMSDETFATVAAIAGDVGFHLGESITEVMLNNGKSKSNIGPYIISSKGSGKVSASKEKVEITGDVQSHIRKDKKKSSTQFLQEIQFIANNSIVRSPNTEYLINTSEGSTEVCVIEGLVIVSPLNVECNEIEVSAGECITINAQGNISDYYSLDLKKEENWWEGWPLITGIDDDEIREIDGGEMGKFLEGNFDIEINEDGKTYNTQWYVFTEGSLVDIVPMDDHYPKYEEGVLTAFIDGGKLFVYNNCSATENDCDQIFEGALENKILSGTFDINGTERGTWTMRPIRTGGSTNSDYGKIRHTPISDSHIYQYTYSQWNKADWGAHQTIHAGYHPAGGEKRTFMKFDLQDLNPDNVSKAMLRLYHYHTGGNPELTLGVYEVTEPWEEGDGVYKPHSNATGNEVCWINQPGFVDKPIVTFSPGQDVEKWVEVDISSLVRDWAAGMPNQGLMVKAVGPLAGQGECNYGFYAKEHEDSDKRPQLVITPMSKEGPLTDQDDKDTDDNDPNTDTDDDVVTTDPDGDKDKDVTDSDFSDDFENGHSNWDVSKSGATIENGKLTWQEGNHNGVIPNFEVPLQNVMIEFDGWTSSNGIAVEWKNEQNDGYNISLGAYYNTASHVGYIDKGKYDWTINKGNHITINTWQHYKFILQGNMLKAYLDNELIGEHLVVNQLTGNGILKFSGYGTKLSIDNVHIQSIGSSHQVNNGIENKDELPPTTAITQQEKPTLEKLWEHDLRDVESDDLYITNSLALGLDGNIYYGVAGGSGVLARPLRIHAINKNTGQLLWKSEKLATVGLQSQILVGDDGSVYVASGHKIYAFDPQTGATNWVWEVPEKLPDPNNSDREIYVRGGVGHMAITDEGNILANTGAVAGHYRRGIYLVDRNGRLIKHFHKSVGSGVLTGLYIGKENTAYYYARGLSKEDSGLKLVALNLNTGRINWTVGILGTGAGENNIAIQEDGNLFCSFAHRNPQDMRYHIINGEDGSFMWSGTESAKSFYKLVGSDGTLFRGRNAIKIDPVSGGIVPVTKGYPYDGATLGALTNNQHMITAYGKNRVGTMGVFDPMGTGESIVDISMHGLQGESMAVSEEGVIYAIVKPKKIVAVRGDSPLSKNGWPRQFHDNRNTSNINKEVDPIYDD